MCSCAEDPTHDFQSATGILNYLRSPQEGPQVRFHSGVMQGGRIQVHYDPLLAFQIGEEEQ